MARLVVNLGWLASATLAAAVAASSPAVAGDRYGADGHRGSEELEAVDPCAVQQHIVGHGCVMDGSRSVTVRRGGADWERSGSDEELEAVDPCAVQYRLTGHGCEGRYARSARVYEDARGYAGSDEGYDRDTYDYPHQAIRRDESVYGYEDAPIYDRQGDDGYVIGCIAVHARFGERCPYERRERIVETERLPSDFFVSDGGVGGGIVDFGGGGGGGGFAFADSFSNANANASASAAASARVSVSIMGHNHMMKMTHYEPRMMHHGCGCRK